MSNDRMEARPLHDILCEAAGYLVKLGTNLQLRAERLRQRKLSTKHSVRKVTDKVLLICDLSKKSIEKVEDVVRDGVSKEGLDVSIDEHRHSTGSSGTVVKSSGRVEKAKLRKVGNLLVRIPKQVNLAHFESCQVRARALPISFLDKYPIYLHCKTWKARKANIAREVVSVDQYDLKLEHTQSVRKSSSSDVQENSHKKIKPRRIISSDENSSDCKFPNSHSGKHDNGKSEKCIANINFSKSMTVDKSSEAAPRIRENMSPSLLKCVDDDELSSQNNNEKSKIFGDGENSRSPKTSFNPGDSSKSEKYKLANKEKSAVTRDNFEVRTDSFEERTENFKGRKDNFEERTDNFGERTDNLGEKTDHFGERTDNSGVRTDNIEERKNMASEVASINTLETVLSVNKSQSEKHTNNLSRTKVDEGVTKENCKKRDSAEATNNKLETFPKNIPDSTKRVSSPSSDKDQAKTTKNEEAPNKIVVKDNTKSEQSIIKKDEVSRDNQSHKSSSRENMSLKDSEKLNADSSRSKTPESSENKSIEDIVQSTLKVSDGNLGRIDSNNSDDSENSCRERSTEKKGILKKRSSVLTISSSDDDVRDENNFNNEKQKIISSSESLPNPANILTQETKKCKFEEEKISEERVETEKNIELITSSNSEIVCSGVETVSQKSSESTRPIIKCIDLNKLLKSPIKESDSLLVETHSVYRSTEESKHSTLKQKVSNKIYNTVVNQLMSLKKHPRKTPHSKPKKIDTLDKYWKEISAERALELRELRMKFISKKCTINVAKMPSFTNTFLETHALRQISQEGAVVAKLTEESAQVNSSAKTDLLNESSDYSQGSRCGAKKCSTEKLLKRKHIMESIRAKRLLLTYSSSSDTDEDRLRDKAKGVKENILNEISSGEEDNCQKSKFKENVQKESKEKDQVEEVTKKSDETDKQENEEELKNKSEAHKRKLLDSSSSSISDEETIDSALNMLEKEMQVDELLGNRTRLSSEDIQSGNQNVYINGKQKSDESEKGVRGNERESSKTSSISQVDGNDDGTTGSDSEMGRTTRSRTTASAQNSDTADNDDRSIDGLTNLKSLHQKNRSRESPSSMTDSSKSKKKSKSDSKATSLKDEILLEAESKSSSDLESEDMPASSGLNGQPISELARDDLLGEDSDSTQDTANQSDNASSKSNGKVKADSKKRARKAKLGKVIELDSTDPDESGEEEDIKVRRRKPEVISSDSEAGGSKKKRADKDSDYDEASAASDDSAEQFKKSKRKAKKSTDSDSAGGSSAEARKKKRRRIKQVKESDGSDESGSDIDGKKGGRKNIRKVMGKDQLEEATKKAAREERERMARIAERQKQYNNSAFDESGKPDEIKLDKVVLDFDPETKEPLIQVDSGIVKKLKPHQANGIKFMWDACFESAKQIKKGRGSGCILAHCMGLGKTLQVVSLTHTLLAHEKLTGVHRVLVVCPLSTVLNWVNEFRMWTEFAEGNKDIDIYELSRYKQNHERSHQLKEWMETGGVCVLGYEMFRNLSADNPKKFRKKMLSVFQESLVNPGPDLVVCDEGHLLKNEKTSLSQSMNRVRTLRRIVLTGTPLQNNLKEYYCMVQFVKPNLLGKYNEYLNRFVNPITNGQYTNSTEQDIRVMKRRSHVLHKMLDGAVQRRDYGVLAPFLPPKHEYVLFITLTDVQIKLYQHYLDNYSRRQQGGRNSGFLFPDFQALQRIWTHPLVLKANSERYEIAQQKKRDREEEEDSEGSLVDFLDDDSTPEESTTDEESDVSDISNDSHKKSKKKSNKKSKSKSEASSSRRSTRANPDAKAEELDMRELKDPDEPRLENPTEWWIKLVEEKELEDMRNSNKLMLLFDILRQCEAIGDKLLVFSQSLYSLDLIEQFLSRIDDSTQMGKVEESLANHVGSWSPGLDYFRLDGSTSCENRSIWCKSFNREDNPRARLFLISTRAGGLGINLVAANRVVIFDVSWNPSHDVQSIFRVYRFGQKKPCYVYRFLAMGTMEEKIYERQVTKQAISKRVIDEQQIDRHYNENDLQELYTFQPEPEQPRPVPLLPKDRLFAEMLKDHEKLIYRYHEHDSLLENKEEETLTEEERKAAWEDFENEKNRPPPAPFPSAATGYMPQMNGMNNMLQQQLAIATIMSMLRKDYPGLTEQQMANLLPQLLYADPTLMQKMRALSSMTGGNMMAGGVGAGVGGGALGFQPTWQQQQQMQQQMQLQRIQQQQQAMNAAGGPGVKYYAGGLGSRDPMSMALQQKHQREMMLNSTGDRLRDMLVGAAGPHAQRRAAPHPSAVAAPTHPAEVVNLDDSE